MLSSSEFGKGYLKVEILENTRSGVDSSGGAPRFTAEHGWFQFSARVTAQQDSSDVYFVMRYNRLGEAAFNCKSLGDMRAGQTKIITFFKKLDYEMAEQLHFYSGMEEIRTNLVPSSYTYQFGDFILEPVEDAPMGHLVASVQ